MDKRGDIVKRILRCPVCCADMTVTEDLKSALCMGTKRHCFDFSAQGYLSLALTGGGGDSKEAVNARRSFLASGYYEAAAQAVCRAVSRHAPDCSVLIDAGCGEGYYTEMLAQTACEVIGFDLSKHGCAAAAKQARRDGACNLLYATASVFELPVKDASADAVVNIFAPCAEEEYARVLREGGYLFVVGAGKSHLMGLKRAIYSDVYENTERADLPKHMEHVATYNEAYTVTVNCKEHIEALFSMTPYYWRTSVQDKDKLSMLDALTTEVEFEINVYRK